MKNTKKTFSFSSLSIYRQFLIISCISMLTVLALSLLLFIATHRIFSINTTNYARISTERFRNELEVLCLQLNVISDQIQEEPLYQELLSAKTYRDLYADTVNAVNDRLTAIKSLNSNISDIALVNGLIHQSTLFSADDLENMYREFGSDGSASGHGIGLMKSSFLPLSDNTYYVYRSNIFHNGRAIGCIFLSIDINKIRFNAGGRDAATDFFVMDKAGNLHPVNDNSNVQDHVIEDACHEYISLLSSGGSPEYSLGYQVQKDKYFIQINYSDTVGCYIVSAVYIPSIIEMLGGIWMYLGIILIAIIVFPIVLIFVLFKNMICPLNLLNNKIDQMGSRWQRHLTVPLNVEGCAEVRNLANTFSNMFSTIDNLNMQIFETSSKLYEEKIRGQATEISYYQSQINPHFLYNVLTLIRSLALTRNVPEIASIAIAMGKMYRYNAKGTNIVPFREELEMTKAYVEIQKYRFPNKFDIFYNVPEEALDIPVIKIILQPLVENSIQHGIEPSLESCMLYIGCTLTEKDFYIEIRDDGVGIAPERLQTIQTLLKEEHYDTTNYVGIINTNARLRLKYGPEYGISIESREHDGTTITVHMPRPGKE